MKQFGSIILQLVVLCVVCAVAAFLLPGLPGTIFSGMTVVLAGIVGVLCVSGLVYIWTNRVYTTD
ncbi:MAG: hypothetical protein KBS74_08475 [Clostridiales bacterium]|nr:hypothetical protein [Candidatus Cacconaster stercorequi]